MKKQSKIILLMLVVISIISCNNKPTTEAKTIEQQIEDTIFSLKEVQEINRYIDSLSNHKKGVSIMVDTPANKENNYVITAGFNNEDRFETYFIFYFNDKTRQISIEEAGNTNIFTLDEWRNNKNDALYSTKGSALAYKEKIGELSLEFPENKVIKILGNPDKKTEAIKWDTDGLFHQEWIYGKKGIELDLCWDNNKPKQIFRVTISKPCDFKTSRNIRIVSTKQEVVAAYNEEINKSKITDTLIIAGSEFGGLMFTLEKNKVVSIFLGSAAE